MDSSVFICDDNFSRKKVRKVSPLYYTKRKNGSLWVRGQLIKKESNADTLKSDIVFVSAVSLAEDAAATRAVKLVV